MLKASVAADHADQAAEDRLAAVLRRRQEQEDDKVASTHLRRNGLPTRVLIDKVRGRWSAGPGGVDRQVAHIANALSARRICFEAAWRRLRDSGKPQEVEYIEAKDGTIVLARHLQLEILDRIDHNWRQSEQGKVFVQKALDKVAAKAQAQAARQQRGAGASTPVLRCPASTRGAHASTPDQMVGASTPDQAVGTELPGFE